jgi:hypothetical protein
MTKTLVLLILVTIVANTSLFTALLKVATNALLAPVIVAWITAVGTLGRITLIAAYDLFKNTEFVIASVIVTLETWVQVMNPTAEAISSGLTVA